MKMNFRDTLSASCLVVFAVSVTASTAAQADPRVGNGGGAWVCRDNITSQTRWMELVDLFEAQNEYGNTLVQEAAAATPWSIFNARITLLKTVSPSFQKISIESQTELSGRLQMLPPETGLTDIDDALIRVRPAPDSCEHGDLFYGQLANFTQDGRLLIDASEWNQAAFGIQGQGALLVHEAVYKAMRDTFAEQNSARARQIVGVLFSVLTPEAAGARIEDILATPPIPDATAGLADCIAQARAGSSAPVATRHFQLTGGIDRATIAIGDFEFSVDVDLKNGQPTNLEIHNLKTDVAIKKNDFGLPATGSNDSVYSAYFPADANGESASLTCTH